MDAYPFKQLGRNLKTSNHYYYSYKFKTCCGKLYLVETTILHQNLVEFAFFLSKDQNANYSIKFGRLANPRFPRKVLRTCISIAQNFMKTHDSEVSFIFLGFPKPNKELTLRETKRYKIYKGLAAQYFNPQSWVHIYNSETSIYMLLNNKNLFIKSNAEQLYRDYEQGILERIGS